MQNQGIAQVERQGSPHLGFNVIRAVLCQDWKSGLRWRGPNRAQSGVIGGNPGTFPGFEQAADRPAGDAQTVTH